VADGMTSLICCITSATGANTDEPHSCQHFLLHLGTFVGPVLVHFGLLLSGGILCHLATLSRKQCRKALGRIFFRAIGWLALLKVFFCLLIFSCPIVLGRVCMAPNRIFSRAMHWSVRIADALIWGLFCVYCSSAHRVSGFP